MEKKEEGLIVRMLGGFSVYYGDLPVVPKNARRSKVLLLLQYLLCNRDKMIGQDVLIDILFSDGECADPVAVLKNLAYRLRKLLREAGVPGECVFHRKNSYCFSTALPCRIDIEEFAALAERAAQEKQKSEVFEICLQAAELYGGEFLPREAGEFWVMGYSVFLQDKYFNCLHTAYEIASAAEMPEKILRPLMRAVSYYPYEENLCIMYIMTLHRLNRFDDAIRAYENITSMILDDLGVSPSARMRETYAVISGGLRETAVSPIDVRDQIQEKQKKAGAYYCNIEVFSELYRIVVRDMERSGRSVFLMLCTVSEPSGSAPASGPRMQRVIHELRESIEAALRRGDVYTRFSPTQFVLMLMDLKQEDCRKVEDRLRCHFYKTHPKNRQLRLTCRTTTAADIDYLLDRDGFA